MFTKLKEDFGGLIFATTVFNVLFLIKFSFPKNFEIKLLEFMEAKSKKIIAIFFSLRFKK